MKIVKRLLTVTLLCTVCIFSMLTSINKVEAAASGSVASYSSVSSQYNGYTYTVGKFSVTIKGGYKEQNVSSRFAFCCQHSVATPPKGTKINSVTRITNATMRKVLYYGYAGPKAKLSKTDKNWVITSLALSRANGDTDNTNMGKEFHEDVKGYATPPDNFAVYKCNTANSKQDLVYWVMPDSYTVAYNANGGTGSMTSDAVKFKEEYFTRENEFTAPRGYSFKGWNESADGSGTDWTAWISTPWTWTYLKSITLYAQWEKDIYTIEYDANGGTGTMDPHTVDYEGSIKIKDNEFEAPTDYKFIGWTTNPDGTDDGYGWSTASLTGWSGTWKYIDGEYGIANKTLKLYARWEPLFQVEEAETISFYEGERVTKELLMAKLTPEEGENPIEDIRITKIEYSVGKVLPDGTKTTEKEIAQWESDMPEDYLLDTWHLQLDKADSPILHKIYYEIVGSDGSVVSAEGKVEVIYNEFPKIKAEDYYFTVKEAQEGKITYEELMRKGRSWDLEDCTAHCPDGDRDGESCLEGGSQCGYTADNLEIVGWDEDLFKNYTDKGYAEPNYQVLTYHVTDKYGKETFKQFAVYIISDGTVDEDIPEITIRFIDLKNYLKSSEEEGGLQIDSLWYKETEYVDIISSLLEKIDDGTAVAESSWTFDYGEVDDVKEYIKTNGIGNSLNSNGIAGFITEFK